MCLLLKQVIDPGLVTLLALAFVVRQSSQGRSWLNHLMFTFVLETLSYLESASESTAGIPECSALDSSLAHVHRELSSLQSCGAVSFELPQDLKFKLGSQNAYPYSKQSHLVT